MGGAKLKGFELSAEDGSKLLLSYDSYEKLLIRGVRIGVRRPVKLAAITVNPVSAYGFHMDPKLLLDSMRAAVSVPVVNVESKDED